MNALPRLLVTVGEPAGIGPDICLQLATHPLPAAVILLGDMHCLRSRATILGLPVRLEPWQEGDPWPELEPGVLRVLDIPLLHSCRPGHLDPANAPAVLRSLDKALDLLRVGLADALVTAPVHKGIINDAGIPFTGHTEYLAASCGQNEVVMLLAGRGLRVALATTHLPLAAVPTAITRSGLERTLRILQASLIQDFALAAPRIMVAGLNPHAGEGGHLGHEETEIIIPVIHALQQEGMRVSGPWPADTLFTPRLLEDADAVLAMYHDQGLPVLKYHAFGEAVNITLGLPIVRTSVDHGTALDVAGTGRAQGESLLHALDAAAEIVRNRRMNRP
ncbi:4-hydroxythreonine-4-phosphate dehydrogenase PdxA [Acidithiobacillus sulfurivorans]|uniref:4-hydroxythreonine-4-phosphate dehydrogenase n=1 Tax=Acidithiobacillus sulfurivorans TaxID=1958756 RepID=A0ABS6A1H1_9PROT|nr:4-hydroxythreonine-4-phosphate dehydrogenase PdxA [Acidithiobacillus sulfurivorans]MBU2761347.1 4-hydroxythreonine-4-phosphate dehydrogenase PdxA [Acidithiobacillus sulfurivorans]